MNAQKLLGLFFIVMGVVQIFHAIYMHTNQGREVGSFYNFVTALLFTVGAALVWRASRVQSKT